MAKRRREPSPIGTTPTEAAETVYNTVFIDTSLDTHLAMLVSYCDTVSDLKGNNLIHLRMYTCMCMCILVAICVLYIRMHRYI